MKAATSSLKWPMMARGLPVDRIRAKVLANGLAAESELAGMSDTQLQRFIFRAGFSTAAVVTAVSGRGVGMDVVKTNIEKIGGTIDLKSTAGQGTTFFIKIPLTLAIVSALIVEAGGERFAIPQISVVELVRAHRQKSQGDAGSDTMIEHINNTPVLRLRDRLLPLVSLTELLALDAASQRTDGDATIVVTQVGAEHAGHHRRSRLRHRGDRGEAGGTDPAPHHHVQRQHHPGRRVGDHDPRPQRDRPRYRRRRRAATAGCERPGRSRPSGPATRTAMLLFRVGESADHGRATRPGRPAGGHSTRQDRDLRRLTGHPVSRQADAAGGAVRPVRSGSHPSPGAGVRRPRSQPWG